ncbi:guanylate cyclase soluble subunit beta-2-like [Salmo salar]|uniref:guanylate cyclase n=1 Tax=Salmo salar TaxID=8030 RepID=A0ABM3D1H6_SALSA|nr:guanylate cyclase soluble subunit beta-2-like [Salmo salar]
MPSEVVLKLFGEYFFSFCKMAGYDTMLRTLGGNLVEFIENLDALHSYLALSYQEMNAPSFRVEKNDDGRMLLHYYSDRKGLYHIVPGIIEAVAKDFFDSEVSMTILNQSEEDERTGKKEHVFFRVSQRSRGSNRDFRPQRENKEVTKEDEEIDRRPGVPVCPTALLGKDHTGTWLGALSCLEKEELRILSRHLEMEKKKTETLLYAMLPRHVAKQLKEGKRVEAGEFQVCTILFSDVVTFTNICAACEPIQIVNMLNSMYSKFDRLTSVHDVYKVETIGDAYMVVGGVPIPADSHAERVANFALAMRIAAREVTNPITGQPIQIRVGLHTGPVLAGMESHGVPDHIHLSPFTYSALEVKGFDILERGEIQVKGKGLMTTYFLLQNLCVSEDTIMARGTGEPCVYRDNKQGAGESEREEPDSVRKEETNGQTTASASSLSDLTNEDTPFLGDTTPFKMDHLNDVNSQFCRLL